MAHLWLHETTDGDAGESIAGSWSAMLLEGDSLAMASARLLHSAGAERESWVLVGPPAVRVNGTPLDTGIRVLRDRDELLAGGVRTFFSTETLATVVPFPESDKPTYCARCKLAIVPGTPAVKCPQCGVWHHQSEELPCWMYAPHCTACDQPTPLDAGFRWIPEEP